MAQAVSFRSVMGIRRFETEITVLPQQQLEIKTVDKGKCRTGRTTNLGALDC
jgi:hypothetical protein